MDKSKKSIYTPIILKKILFIFGSITLSLYSYIPKTKKDLRCDNTFLKLLFFITYTINLII